MDINDPRFYAATQAAIAAYGSPEAAQADFETNAPRANAAFIARHQALTGDAFSDPWESLQHTRDTALTELATKTNTSFAVGGSNGPAVLLPAPVSQAMTAADGTHPAPLLRTQRLNDAERIATLQPAIHAPMPDLPLPYTSGTVVEPVGGQPTSPFSAPNPLMEAQRQRVNRIGSSAVQLFDRMWAQNPRALRVNPVDPLLERDAKGNPLAGDVLNLDLFHDQGFQHMMKIEPQKAAAFYEAITGHPLETAITAQNAATANRQKIRQDVVERMIKGLKHNEFGEPEMQEYIADPMGLGGKVSFSRPLNDAERMVYDRGGLEEFGFRRPSPPPIEGSPAAQAAVLEQAKREREMHPHEPLSQILLRAKAKVIGDNPQPRTVQRNPGLIKRFQGGGDAWSFRAADFLGTALGPLSKLGNAVYGDGTVPYIGTNTRAGESDPFAIQGAAITASTDPRRKPELPPSQQSYPMFLGL